MSNFNDAKDTNEKPSSKELDTQQLSNETLSTSSDNYTDELKIRQEVERIEQVSLEAADLRSLQISGISLISGFEEQNEAGSFLSDETAPLTKLENPNYVALSNETEEQLKVRQLLEKENDKAYLLSEEIPKKFHESNNNDELQERNEELGLHSNDRTCIKTLNPFIDPTKVDSDRHRYVEPTVSTLEREILLKGETSDNKKTKVLQLPPEIIPHSPNYCEREIVGDDVAKTIAHILCECEQPGVAGGAVPIVTSFTVQDSNSKLNGNDKPEPKMPLPKRNLGIENILHKPRPSLIPKLSTSFRNNKLNSLSGPDENNCPVSSSIVTEEEKAPRNINFQPVPLQEPLGSTLPKQSVSQGNGKDDKNDLNENDKQCHLRFHDSDYKNCYKKLTKEFSKNVSRLAEEASNISEIENPTDQLIAVDKLYQQVTFLKKIAQELKFIQSRGSLETIVLDRSQNMDENQANIDSNSRSRSKDNNNRIYIKFLPSKSAVKKRKSCNSEVQTDFVTNATSTEPKILKKLPNEEINLKEVDSMDGMFIPSFDEPPKMEDDDDEDGLDITIRFPELQNNLDREDNSHLSVCFSNISAEALGRLKRCPKEFTLRMDFVQGKMFFQSGRSPANNFAIGPDLKITECIIDNRQSDIISIKPSTECLYTSQIIPVEGATRKESIKILKSTDSELFSVVSIPFVNRRNSVATKSCITFKNSRRMSNESLLPVKTYYNSMPQIPSLTKIMEEPALESVASSTRAAAINAEKKRRYRSLQKKRTNASLDNLIPDAF